MKTQMKMFEESQQHLSNADKAFMEMVTQLENPMTNQDLERLIVRWPERFGRFSNWLGKLKDEEST